MEEANLDHWNTVREELQTHPITGAFKKVGRCFSGKANWHYTGTYYWFRNHDVYSRNWRNVRKMYGGTELWPATMFSVDESGCHFYEGSYYSLYNADEVTRAEICIKAWPWKMRNG